MLWLSWKKADYGNFFFRLNSTMPPQLDEPCFICGGEADC